MTADDTAVTSSKGKRRKARTDVALVMIFAAVASVLVIGAVNFFQSRAFLIDEAEAQLLDVGASRAARIERGLVDLQQLTSAIAISPTVGEALAVMSEAFEATDEVLTPTQSDELSAFYQDSVDMIAAQGGEGDPPLDLGSVSQRTQYLQYWYLAANPFDDRSDLVDPGDGSPYSAEHARFHPFLRRLTDGDSIGDVMLIDTAGDIVYTVDKRIDFATNASEGPFSDELISEAISTLQASPVGEAVLVDFTAYPPAGGEMEMWVITLVRWQDEVLGALAASVPNQVLVDITTAGEMWEETGLGETGEVYLVGNDGLLRTESRLFLEDPEGYVSAAEDAGYGPEITDRVNALDTTVLIQPADTEAVIVAQQGDEFSGGTTNYLGRRTVAVSERIGPQSLGWVVVSEVEQKEIAAPLYAYLRRLALATILIVIAAVIIALVAARRLLRPIDPIVDAAARVGAGDLDVQLPDAGRDEFAYLSSQLNAFVDELVQRRDEVAATEAETTELLASVVPRRLVGQVMAGDRDIAETMSNAALIAMTVKGSTHNLKNLEQFGDHKASLVEGMSAIAAQYGAEQLSSSAVTWLYATGLDVEDPRIEDAVEFGMRASTWLSDSLAAQGYLLAVSVGIASGDLVTGVMGTERLTVDVIGAPRQVAGALSMAADQRQLLVDAEVAGSIGGGWRVERVSGLEDVSGAPLDAWQVTERPTV